VERLVPVAQRVIADPGGLWKEARGEARTVLQRFLLPEVVPFYGDSFGTAVASPLFSRLREWERSGGKMVTQVLPSWNQVREWLLELEELRRGHEKTTPGSFSPSG